MKTRKYTKNPGGLLDIKELYEEKRITRDEYLEMRTKILDCDLLTREITYCKCGNPTIPESEFCKDCI